MYQKILKFCFAVSAGACSVGAASAQDFNHTIAAGKRTLVGQFALYNSFECTPSATPEGKIARAPSNGRLEIVAERRTIKTDRCGVINFVVTAVYYTPKAGFRGVDEASVDFTYYTFTEGNSSSGRRQSYTITVK